LSGVADQCDGAGLKSGNRLEISVGANFGVPTAATAVVLNVTAIDPAATGYLTVYPSGEVPPTASNLNYRAGRVVANLVEVGLGALGDVTLFTSQATDLAVDIEGYVEPGSGQGYHPLSGPVRVCDTRTGNPSNLTAAAAQCDGQTLAAGATLAVTIAGSSFGVPSGATAVVFNLTAVHPSAQGYLTAYADGGARPTASNVNYASGVVVPNRVIVPLGADGAVDVFAFASTDVIVDVSGYYQGTGSQYTPLASPVRICDTRTGNPSALLGPATQCNGNPLGSGSVRTVSVEGFGAPATATAVVLNVTAVAPTQNTFLTVFPGGIPPTASDLNPAEGSTEPNMVVASVGAGGVVDIYNLTGSINVVFDLEGWYQ
ncbi:MAG TPA: hypothetical protein VG184_06235, partial [Acidimicrobiales bacterium]|nr:hypothetical protein [Acidimicrobiales bacterium]